MHLSLKQFLAILRARWQWVFGLLASIVLLTVLATLVWPKKYTAEAVLVVDSKPDPLSATTMSSVLIPGYLATQVEIAQSQRVALRVVRNLRMADSDAMQVRLEWQEDTNGVGSIDAWLASRLLRDLNVKPSRDANLITVGFTSDTAEDAALKANAFSKAFLDTNLELRTEPAKQYAGFFDGRAKQLREELERAQTRLSNFQREKGILAADERLDIESARLSELSSQLVAIQAMTAESTSRKFQARTETAQLQDVLTNPLIIGLKSDLSRGEAKLRELSAQLGDAHPSVVQAKANIAETRTRLEAETRRIGSGVGVTNAINQAREAEVRAALEAQRAKVLKTKEQRDELAVMQRDVENAQRAYDTVLSHLSQTSLESENKLPNVSVLTEAVVPTKPSSPRVVVNVVVAVLVGLLVGVGAALAAEFRDRRIRTVEDIATILSLPVVGSLGAPIKKRWYRRVSSSPLQQHLLRSLPSPGAD